MVPPIEFRDRAHTAQRAVGLMFEADIHLAWMHGCIAKATVPWLLVMR